MNEIEHPPTRKLSGGETVMLWISFLTPPIAFGFGFWMWFVAGYNSWPFTEAWLIGIPIVWLGLNVGCGWFASLLMNTVYPRERRETATLVVLLSFLQLFLSPIVSWGACTLLSVF